MNISTLESQLNKLELKDSENSKVLEEKQSNLVNLQTLNEKYITQSREYEIKLMSKDEQFLELQNKFQNLSYFGYSVFYFLF